MSRTFFSLAGAMMTVGLIGACTDMAPSPGRETYTHYCASCHGNSAVGDGPIADSLPVPPADLTVLRLANDGAFPTEHVMATVYGYPGKHAFSAMPEFGPLLEGPKQIWVSPKGEEIMTPVALLELVSYLGTLQR
ncbi:cytochrome c [Alisedimentitalea sp. MJ-SS2]|uniref:cytochrome c n=1 Tax=Aliisedimentitalea sp. MJ-SS2 TaxID=3049795 RepID=UPI002906CF5B|nr:cytochrome c [Alisedimentitalea sp. MJ-SS2]MDU8928877.1 cytochrome c [Alisedimentitalea sp. MJ-SS2]